MREPIDSQSILIVPFPLLSLLLPERSCLMRQLLSPQFRMHFKINASAQEKTTVSLLKSFSAESKAGEGGSRKIALKDLRVLTVCKHRIFREQEQVLTFFEHVLSR